MDRAWGLTEVPLRRHWGSYLTDLWNNRSTCIYQGAMTNNTVALSPLKWRSNNFITSATIYMLCPSRSHEERSQILLALLSRYYVLARTIGSWAESPPARNRSPDVGADSCSPGENVELRYRPRDTQMGASVSENINLDDGEIPADLNTEVGDEIPSKKADFRTETGDCELGGKPALTASSRSNPQGMAYEALPGTSHAQDCEDNKGIPGHSTQTVASDAPDVGCHQMDGIGGVITVRTHSALSMFKTFTNGEKVRDPSLASNSSEPRPLTTGSTPCATEARCDGLPKFSDDCRIDVAGADTPNIDTVDTEQSIRRRGMGSNSDVNDADSWKEALKACEDAFLELMSDERTR